MPFTMCTQTAVLQKNTCQWVRAFGAITLLIWMPLLQGAAPLISSAGRDVTLAPMLERVVPGVVNISTRARVRVRQNPLLSDPFFRRFFDFDEAPQRRETQSTGSGVIVDAKAGHVVTNYHVIQDAEEILVTLNDGRRFTANRVGVDSEVDLAVIKIKPERLTAVPLGDSGHLRVGDFVVAIGNPFGLGQTVTSGIVSALGRSGLGIEGYEDFIQTDASINPGNSGGPLVNLQGELVGVNTAIVGRSGGNIGIGFAIPSNMARAVMTQIIKYGEVRHGQLGVIAQDLSPELARAFGLRTAGGAVVARVELGSPADRAGLRSGDIVAAVNGRPIRTASALRNAIGILRVGTEVTLDIVRNGRRRSVRTVLVEPERPLLKGGEASKRLAGATLGPIGRGHPLSGRVEGVGIKEVERGSPAWSAGLRQGDVIIAINRQKVSSIDDVSPAIAQFSHRLLLNIVRGDTTLLLVIR
jgi:Do/DeqQ family serine protease